MNDQKINDENMENNSDVGATAEDIVADKDNIEAVEEIEAVEDLVEDPVENLSDPEIVSFVEENTYTPTEDTLAEDTNQSGGYNSSTAGSFDSSQINYGEVKKSKKGIGFLGAAGIVVLLLVAIGVGFFIWYKQTGSGEFYKVGGENIPTINHYLGRNITPSSLEKGVEATDEVDDHSYYYVSYSIEDITEDDFFNYIGDAFTEEYFVWYDILEDGNYSHLTAVKDNGHNMIFVYFSGGETDFYIDIMVYTETENQRQYFEEIKQNIESNEEIDAGEEIESEESKKP